jgi:guanylate kinase
MGKAQKRLIALSGPSCVGKGPLLAGRVPRAAEKWECKML